MGVLLIRLSMLILLKEPSFPITEKTESYNSISIYRPQIFTLGISWRLPSIMIAVDSLSADGVIEDQEDIFRFYIRVDNVTFNVQIMESLEDLLYD